MEGMTTARLNALNAICPGWTESRPDGLLCSPHPGGGIIDCSWVSREWFVIFNDGRPPVEGFDSRDDAIEAFAMASRMTESQVIT